jgi:hypothetical protein
MAEKTGFVALEWLDDLAGYPRYSFATMVHAEEFGDAVRWLQRHASMDTAVEAVTRLNCEPRPTRQPDHGVEQPQLSGLAEAVFRASISAISSRPF